MAGLGEFLSIAAAATWALGVILYRKLGADLPPLLLNLLKNAIVLGLMVPTVLVMHGLGWPALSPGEVGIVLLSGALGIALADTLYFRALNHLGAGPMGIIGNLFSPFVIALAFLFLGERLSLPQLLGFVLVMGGVGVVHGVVRADPTIPTARRRLGVLEGMAAVFLNAVGVVMVKTLLEDGPFFWISALRLVGGLSAMLLIWPWLSAHFRMPPGRAIPWPTLLLAAFVGQYVSMLCWLGGYRYIDASVASVLNETAAIFILLFAALLLGEKFTRRKLLGVALTFSGVAVIVMI
jgi:drug/metabolite transporter (DMT)-like permease